MATIVLEHTCDIIDELSVTFRETTQTANGLMTKVLLNVINV